jgi:hypothetical protein
MFEAIIGEPEFPEVAEAVAKVERVRVQLAAALEADADAAAAVLAPLYVASRDYGTDDTGTRLVRLVDLLLERHERRVAA